MMTSTEENQSCYFVANGLQQHYWRWGDKHAPTIILLHGIRSYGKTWLRTAALLKQDFQVIALDLRGRGNSDWSADESYYYPDYLADLEALVAHLALDEFYLLGHSLGGQNALVYSAKHPNKVKALIIEDIGPGSSASGDGAARIVREFKHTPQSFESWQAGTDFWRSIRPNISQASLSQRVAETLTENAQGKIVWSYDFVGIKNARLAAAEDHSKLPDLWPAVKSLQCPTLVLRGALSDFLPKETLLAMAHENPSIQIAEVSNATHYVHDDNFDEFYQYLHHFLDQVVTNQLSESC